jgi:fatty acid desaturase
LPGLNEFKRIRQGKAVSPVEMRMDDARPRDMSRVGEAVEHVKPRPGRRRGVSRGYRSNHLPDDVVQKLKAWESTSLAGSMFDCAAYLASIVIVAALCVGLWNLNPGLGAASYAVALVLIARQQRAIELMVHDASHWSWDRDNKVLNDRMADCCVGYPVMSTTGSYRKGHFIHHGTFAGEQDPCKRRFASMGLGHVDLSTKWAIAKAVLRWLPSYNLAYYTEIGSKSWAMFLRWALWHLAVFIVPLSLVFGVAQGLLLWTLFWLVPMFTSLPVLRSIAEAEEHDYERGDTEFDATFTNDGWIHHLLWHPWNDAYHQVHHLYPNISQRQHHKVHKLLLQHDEKYRNGPIRTTTLQQIPLQ